jgi:predicted transcriptional regulator
MKIHFAPELEAKLNDIASGSGRSPEQFVQDLVKSYLDHDQWFRKEVQKGLGQLDCGEFLEHDEVVARIEDLFRSSSDPIR